MPEPQTKVIRMHINHTPIMQRFAADAIGEMEQFIRSNGTVEYGHLYSFAHAVRIVLGCIDTTDPKNLEALKTFRDEYDKMASRMFQHLEKLREEQEQEPF